MTGVPTLDLRSEDGRQLLSLADAVRAEFGGADNPDLRAELPLLLGDLPGPVRRFLDTFRRTEPAGAALIRGLPVDDAALGPTPDRWDPADPTPLATALDCYLMLVGTGLGDVFAWQALQGGRMVHNVLPVAGHEQEKTGVSS